MSNEKSKFKIGVLWRKYSMVIILIALLIVCAIVEPVFLTWSNVTNLMRQISANGILAVGMAIVIISGGIDLGVGKYTVCLMVILVGLQRDGINWGVAILLTLIAGAIIGVINGLCIHKGMIPFVMTMVGMTFYGGLARVLTGAKDIKGIQAGFKFFSSNIFGIPVSFLLYLVILVIFALLMKYTKWGRDIYAMGGNPLNARLSGVKMLKTKLIAYGINGIACALAAVVLAARLQIVTPVLGDGFELDAIASVIIGGIAMNGGEGNLTMSLIGAILIGIISNMMNLTNFNIYWQDVIKGVIIFVSVFVDVLRRLASKRAENKLVVEE